MPQLDPTWFASQLFWLLVTFLTLYTMLSRVILPSLQGVLAQRQYALESDIELAERYKQESEAAKQHYEQTLAASRERVQQLMSDAANASKTEAEQSSRVMDKQIMAKLDEATQRIAAQKQQLLDALTPAAGELTSLIVEKLTHHAASGEQVQRALAAIAKQR